MATQTSTLRHVNYPPAETWNWLRINDIALEVPRAPETPKAAPSKLAHIEMGSGEAATTWADAIADGREELELAPHTTKQLFFSLTQPEHRALDITLGEGATLTLFLLGAVTEGMASNTLRVSAQAGAHLEIVDFVANHNATYLNNIGIELAAGATASISQFVLSGQTNALGYAVNQAGEKSRVDFNVHYLVGNAETADLNYTMRMRGCNTKANLRANGVLMDNATKCLRDTIDLIHGAKGAHGMENETVLLAGDPISNKSLPTILCDEDDVAGDHGATIGSITPEQLAYLADRGLTEQEAQDLFAHAIIDDALNHVPAELDAAQAIRSTIVAAAKRNFGSEYAAELEVLLGQPQDAQDAESSQDALGSQAPASADKN